MVDGDFNPRIRVTTATLIIAMVVIFILMDLTLFIFLASLPLGGHAAFFRLVGLLGTLARFDE